MMTKLKACMRPTAQPMCTSTVLLILRLVAGVAFAIHGFGKIQNPMAWMGPDAPVPGILQLLAAVAEFGGGIAWVLGLFTCVFSFGIFCTMAVAVIMHAVMMKDPFVNPTGGASWELAAVYLSVALLFMNMGAGKLSLDAKIFGERN